MDKQVVGNVGLYYVCYQLSRLGLNVMPTARNARGIDLVAYDAAGTDFVGIQVKALSKRDAVPLSTKLDGLMGDYWIIVADVAREPSAYVMTPHEVREAAHRSGPDGRASYWLERGSYEQPAYREAWRRIRLIGGAD